MLFGIGFFRLRNSTKQFPRQTKPAIFLLFSENKSNSRQYYNRSEAAPKSYGISKKSQSFFPKEKTAYFPENKISFEETASPLFLPVGQERQGNIPTVVFCCLLLQCGMVNTFVIIASLFLYLVLIKNAGKR
ncbi:MAG: hypothetical protein D3924_03660 [Candidatus Electrothrix sp. AR4]|nr:hypothetical protein [Candidatus Electrothrix sp. AR4]